VALRRAGKQATIGIHGLLRRMASYDWTAAGDSNRP
jgi:hypothetical protein